MTKEENSLIIIVWSKLYIAKLLIDVFDHPGFQESIAFHLDAAQAILEQIMEDNKHATFSDGGGI